MEIENAGLKRNLKTGQFYIEIIIQGHDINLWHGIVEHCAASLSNSELRTVYEICNKQIYSMDADDMPLRFKELMDELSQTIINRKAFVTVEVKKVIYK